MQTCKQTHVCVDVHGGFCFITNLSSMTKEPSQDRMVSALTGKCSSERESPLNIKTRHTVHVTILPLQNNLRNKSYATKPHSRCLSGTEIVPTQHVLTCYRRCMSHALIHAQRIYIKTSDTTIIKYVDCPSSQ